MCETLARTWVTFAQTGNPNNSLIPHWPRFEGGQRATLILDRETRVENDPYGTLRRFWADLPAPGSVFG
jgi:para-nitrobenzyl esterase